MSSITGVPLLDTRRANAAIATELEAAFKRVLDSGRFILGGEVEAFEAACARYLDVEHAIGVSSGTDALLVALMALGVKPGDEVICPTYTFFATAGSIWRVGARPVFVDSRPRCFNCDPEDVARKIGPRTKAIIPVHLFGQCAAMAPILELARERGIPVIEDAAQAIGAEHQGRRAGGLGTVGCFSFFPSKNLGGYGDSGLVTTHDPELAQKLRALRMHGGLAQYQHPEVGGNFRIDALQAALLNVKLAHLDDYTARRQHNAALYTRLFIEAGVGALAQDGGACGEACPAVEPARQAPMLLPPACQSRHVFNQYVVRVPGARRRDRLQAALQQQGVTTAVYYPRPMHLQDCFAQLGHTRGQFPVAERLADESLALPVFSELSEEELCYVVERVKKFFAKDQD